MESLPESYIHFLMGKIPLIMSVDESPQWAGLLQLLKQTPAGRQYQANGTGYLPTPSPSPGPQKGFLSLKSAVLQQSPHCESSSLGPAAGDLPTPNLSTPAPDSNPTPKPSSPTPSHLHFLPSTSSSLTTSLLTPSHSDAPGPVPALPARLLTRYSGPERSSPTPSESPTPSSLARPAPTSSSLAHLAAATQQSQVLSPAPSRMPSSSLAPSPLALTALASAPPARPAAPLSQSYPPSATPSHLLSSPTARLSPGNPSASRAAPSLATHTQNPRKKRHHSEISRDVHDEQMQDDDVSPRETDTAGGRAPELGDGVFRTSTRLAREANTQATGVPEPGRSSARLRRVRLRLGPPPAAVVPAAPVVPPLPNPDCPRNGSRRPKKKTKRQNKGKRDWRTDSTSPDLGTNGHMLLMHLGSVGGPHGQDALQSMLAPSDNSSNVDAALELPAETSLAMSQAISRTIGLMKTFGAAETTKQEATFKTLVAYLEFAIQVDHIIQNASLYGTDWNSVRAVFKGLKKLGLVTTKEEAFRLTFHKGLRLASLAQGGKSSMLLSLSHDLILYIGTLYILLVMASLDIDRKFLNYTGSVEPDIAAVSMVLRTVPDNDNGTMVKKAIIPHLRRLIFSLTDNPIFVLKIPEFDTLGSLVIKPVHFSKIAEIDERMSYIKKNLFRLPPRAPAWTAPLSPNEKSDSREPAVAKLETVELPFIINKSPPPIHDNNRDEWTAQEREKASKAVPSTSISDLREKLLHHAPESYLSVNPAICQGNTLKIQDKNQALVGLVVTIFPELYPLSLEATLARLMSLFPGEFFQDSSTREDFRYLAFHYQWYNRFAEKGHGAPVHAHPDNIYREGAVKVNFSQRIPHSSEDITNDPEKYGLVADVFGNLMELIHSSVEKYLPEDCDELRVYVEKLPLGASPAAYPFGGFVLNISGCTRGHRDAKDKKFCVVVPFGKWTGGALCLYEAGLVIELRPGDIFVFPSGDLTHFNLHFEGIRASLAISTDGALALWAADRNGWDQHVH